MAEIHFIRECPVVTVNAYERVIYDPAAVIADRREKTVVHGCLHDHSVTRDAQSLDYGGDCRHDSGGVDHERRVYGIAVSGVKPSGQSLVVPVVYERVAEHPVLDPPPQCIHYYRSCGEVHVGYPKRDHAAVG